MRSVVSSLVVLIAGLACAADPPKPVFDPPPRLATTARELAATKAATDFAAKRDAATKAVEPWLKEPIELPKGSASWTFYYACPDDGTDLHPLSLTEHECPKCKKKYSDERTVAAWRCRQHYAIEGAALQFGWAYAYTGEDRYAGEVRRILLHLADQYPTYPERLDRWGHRGMFAPWGGRRYVQSLDEATGAIKLGKAYDLTRMSPVWTDADRTHVENDFFRATAKTLLTFNHDINNHQSWYNAGLMSIASVLADADLVEKVLTMRGGFHDQLARSFGDDGIWYEGTMAYQNYALQALIEVVEIGQRLKLDLHQTPKFRALLAGPLKMTYPNGTYPIINDSDPADFRIFQWSFEWAWNTWHDPLFAQAAAWGNPQRLKELLGPDAKPVSPFESKSIDLPDIGLAVLRAGEGTDQTCVFFDYGQHGGGHGHFDKLNITLFANGREWLLDTGRIGYTHKEYLSWVKHTVAHNTVAVNETDQSPATGKLKWLKSGDGWTACEGECSTAYSGVTLRRHLLLTPQWLLDVYDVTSKEPAQFDWLAHAVTDPVQPAFPDQTKGTSVAKVGEKIGYPHLLDAQRWTPARTSIWDFPAGSQRLRVWTDGDADDELLTAVGIGRYPTEKAPALIRRRHDAREARFATVYDLSGEGKLVTGFELAKEIGIDITVRSTAGHWRVRFDGKDGVRFERVQRK
jgi:hypothetical protein